MLRNEIILKNKIGIYFKLINFILKFILIIILFYFKIYFIFFKKYFNFFSIAVVGASNIDLTFKPQKKLLLGDSNIGSSHQSFG